MDDWINEGIFWASNTIFSLERRIPISFETNCLFLYVINLWSGVTFKTLFFILPVWESSTSIASLSRFIDPRIFFHSTVNDFLLKDGTNNSSLSFIFSYVSSKDRNPLFVSNILSPVKQVLPPLFVTIAPAIFIIGSQSESVMSVTSACPFLNLLMSFAFSMTLTSPWPILLPTASPSAICFPFSSRTYVCNTAASFCECTVSGLAWTI